MNKEQLKKIRASTGMTQLSFGRAIGVSGKLISMMEQGLREITPRTKKSIIMLLPLIDDKKGVAKKIPHCPFCGGNLKITNYGRNGHKLEYHRCKNGIIEIKSIFAPKDMILRALTLTPSAKITD